jgi:flavodoxin
MKGIVVFDSVYGNTKQVAEAIAEQIRADGHSAETLNLGEREATKVEADFMFIGSPTRIGRMTKKAKAFVEGLDVEYWRNRPIVTFDTVGPMSEDVEKRKVWLARVEKSAATRMRDQAKARGLGVHPDVLHVAVTGFKGPLAPDALEVARDFTHRFIANLK